MTDYNLCQKVFARISASGSVSAADIWGVVQQTHPAIAAMAGVAPTDARKFELCLRCVAVLEDQLASYCQGTGIPNLVVPAGLTSPAAIAAYVRPLIAGDAALRSEHTLAARAAAPDPIARYPRTQAASKLCTDAAAFKEGLKSILMMHIPENHVKEAIWGKNDAELAMLELAWESAGSRATPEALALQAVPGGMSSAALFALFISLNAVSHATAYPALPLAARSSCSSSLPMHRAMPGQQRATTPSFSTFRWRHTTLLDQRCSSASAKTSFSRHRQYPALHPTQRISLSLVA
jgi:hypothetical protein